MSRRSPATLRNLAVDLIAEKERLHTHPTVVVHVEVIRALIEADAERAQSETLRCATAVALESSADWLTCGECGNSDASVDSDPARDVDFICGECLSDRQRIEVPSAFDHAWDSGKADR